MSQNFTEKIQEQSRKDRSKDPLGQMAKHLHSYDSQLKQAISKKRPTRRTHISYRDTKQSLVALKQAIPSKNIKSVINLLYDVVVKRDSEGRKRTSQQINRLSIPIKRHDRPNRVSVRICDNNIQRLGMVEGREVFHFDPLSEANQKIFRSQQEATKYEHKQVVARCLIENQYSWQVFRQFAKGSIYESINRSRYKIIAYSVATDTYRRIEQFLTSQCHIKIKPINHQDLRTLFSLLLNYRSHMKAPHTQTMVKFVAITYHLSPVTIEAVEAIDLYHAIQELLKSKLTRKYANPVYNQRKQQLRPHIFKNTANNPIFFLQKIWNDKFQLELIEAYKKNANFIKIKYFFMENYPEHEKALTVKSLRSQFYKILRVDLKHLAQLISEYPHTRIPKLTKMHEVRIRYVTRLVEGHECRLGLLAIHKKESVDPKHLAKLVTMINAFIKAKESGEYDKNNDQKDQEDDIYEEDDTSIQKGDTQFVFEESNMLDGFSLEQFKINCDD